MDEQLSASRADLPGLVDANLAMATRLAKRYSYGNVPDDDLVQVAHLALYLAATRYDPTVGPFRPYAIATIVGEMKKHLRDHGWAVRVPRRLQESTTAVERIASELCQTLGRSPTPDEIGMELGLSIDEVLEALHAVHARFSSELPAVEEPDRDESLTTLTDRLTFAQAVEQLPDEDCRILRMNYLEEMTQREMAAALDMSQTQVHRRLEGIRDHLRRILDSMGYDP